MIRLPLLPALLALVLLPGLVLAQGAPDFPELTGRVVDQAGMLPPEQEASLTQMLAAHEEATTNQVVVVTLPDLQGYSIEDFGYQLGRHWGIGQEGKDNGALLIVAEAERRVRIEVGYGLEGELTDAAAATIINQIITPAFRQGDFVGGITQGATAMVQVLGGELVLTPTGKARPAAEDRPNLFAVILFFIFVLSFISLISGSGRGGHRGVLAAAVLSGALGGRGGGFGGGGGFSGGGGGFGGGGASGGW